MALLNGSTLLGGLVQQANNYITGDIFLTLVFIFFAFIFVMRMLGTPLNLAALFMLPLALSFGFLSAQWLPVLGFVLLLLAIMLAELIPIK